MKNKQLFLILLVGLGFIIMGSSCDNNQQASKNQTKVQPICNPLGNHECDSVGDEPKVKSESDAVKLVASCAPALVYEDDKGALGVGKIKNSTALSKTFTANEIELCFDKNEEFFGSRSKMAVDESFIFEDLNEEQFICVIETIFN